MTLRRRWRNFADAACTSPATARSKTRRRVTWPSAPTPKATALSYTTGKPRSVSGLPDTDDGRLGRSPNAKDSRNVNPLEADRERQRRIDLRRLVVAARKHRLHGAEAAVEDGDVPGAEPVRDAGDALHARTRRVVAHVAVVRHGDVF